MKFKPPTPEEVTEYAKSINFALDGVQFIAYYETRSWIPSGARKQMSSWKAAVKTWKCRAKKPVSIKKTVLCLCGCGKEAHFTYMDKHYYSSEHRNRMKG